MYAHGFRFYFTPLPGFFSPFPHGTGSLSVDYEYLALEDGPPVFRQDSSCPALLLASLVLSCGLRVRGFHPLPPSFPECSTVSHHYLLLAAPVPLAATPGISVDFFSSGYLDVSVRRVRSTTPMCSAWGDAFASGCPIRISTDQSLFADSPWLFAGCHVLLRL